MNGRILSYILGLLLTACCWLATDAHLTAPDAAPPAPGQLCAVRQMRQPGVAPMQLATTVPFRVNSTHSSHTAPQWGADGSRFGAAAALLARHRQQGAYAYIGKARLGSMPFYCFHPRDYYIIALRRILR